METELTLPEVQSCLQRFGGNTCPRRCGHLCWCCYDGPAMTHNWCVVSLRTFGLPGEAEIHESSRWPS